MLTVESSNRAFCSYQKHNFLASDHVEKLVPKFSEWDEYAAMFISTIINMEQYKYNYGRKCSQKILKKTVIKLPTKNKKPDWKFMKKYIKSLPYSANL